MDEKNKKRISIKMIIIICIIILAISVILRCFVFNKLKISQYPLTDSMSVMTYNDKDYYIIEKDYAGKYDLKYVDFPEYFNTDSNDLDGFEVKEVMSYTNYKQYCNKWGIKAKYSDDTKNYIVYSWASYGAAILETRLAGVEYNNGNVDIYINQKSEGNIANIKAYVLIIPTEEIVNNIEIKYAYTSDAIENIKNDNSKLKASDVEDLRIY